MIPSGTFSMRSKCLNHCATYLHNSKILGHPFLFYCPSFSCKNGQDNVFLVNSLDTPLRRQCLWMVPKARGYATQGGRGSPPNILGKYIQL